MNQQAQKILDIYNSLEDKRPFTWLKGRSYSDAFVICVGAGPWKFARRKAIQQMALDKLAGRDLTEVGEWHPDWVDLGYPLRWQKQFVNTLSCSLWRLGCTFEIYCKVGPTKLKSDINFIKDLYERCGCPNGSKVLSLFCRDALGLPSFPIDRHVKRFLLSNNLPINEMQLVDICFEAGLKPNEVAVAFVRAASDMDNPDWSIK